MAATEQPRPRSVPRPRPTGSSPTLDEEYYLHFAGHKETLDARGDLRALRTSSRGSRRRQRLEGGPIELWRFACEGFLGDLTREHQERIAQVETELEATVDGETIPYRMLRVAMSNEPDRDRRAAARADAAAPARRASEPACISRRRRSTARPSTRSAPRTTTSSTSASASASTSSASECRDAPRRDREALGAGRRQALPLAARDRPRRRPPCGRRAPLPRARARPALPARAHAAGARGDARRPRDRPALTGERPPRPRAAPGQGAARVLRADRGAGQGDARDPADRRQRRLGGALPRGRPHRALRAHLGRRCRWRPSASATWRSPRAGRC